MLKLRIFKILAPVVILTVAASFFIYSKRVPIELLERHPNCRIFTGTTLQKTSCYKNALHLYLTSPNDRDVALTALQDICNEGLFNACYAKDMLRKESSLNFSPYQDHIENGNADAIKCVTAPLSKNDFLKDYFCTKARNYGWLLGDLYLVSEIFQNWYPYQISATSMAVQYNINYNDQFSLDLKEKNCTKMDTKEAREYCKWLDDIGSMRKEITRTLINKKSIPEDLKKLTTSFCKNYPVSCKLMMEDDEFISQAFKLYPVHRKSEFLTDYPLSFDSRMYLWSLIQVDGMLEKLEPTLPADKILSMFKKYQFDKIQSYCNESELTDKQGCFLGFNNFKDALKHTKELENYCTNKDPFSCKLLSIIKENDVLKIKNDRLLVNVYFYYEENVLDSYLDNPLRKISIFIDSHRTTLLTALLIFILLLQIFILVLFKKSSLVFKFIREQIKDKIKNKINSKDN